MIFHAQICTLRFRALESIIFPPPSAANVLRGALGEWLRHSPNPANFHYWFAPQGDSGPSGLINSARPFVIRAHALDNRCLKEGEEFSFDVHVFPAGDTGPRMFRETFQCAAVHGFGVGRGRAQLLELTSEPQFVDLSEPQKAQRIRLNFITPTELKHVGQVVPEPLFAILFARIRDRVSRLMELYGSGAPEVDFKALGHRAASIRTAHLDLQWREGQRRSGRTGQVHPLQGFTGAVEYEGDLSEFTPWLSAAQWTGVGRQTVWGKGAFQYSTIIR